MMLYFKKIVNNPYLKYHLIMILLIFWKKNHDGRVHIESKRVYNEILDEGYYWKSNKNDIKNYINKSAHCIRIKDVISLKPIP